MLRSWRKIHKSQTRYAHIFSNVPYLFMLLAAGLHALQQVTAYQFCNPLKTNNVTGLRLKGNFSLPYIERKDVNST